MIIITGNYKFAQILAFKYSELDNHRESKIGTTDSGDTSHTVLNQIIKLCQKQNAWMWVVLNSLYLWPNRLFQVKFHLSDYKHL